VIVAVASGKGGTGKTTVSVSLALVAAEEVPTTLLDCDAEAPDAALFLAVAEEERRDAGVLVPRVDRERCRGTGECADVCEYGAIAFVGGSPLVLSW